MTRWLKRASLAAALLALLLLAGSVLFLSLFDINSQKGRIEEAASRALGLPLRVEGRLGVTLFPPRLTAQGVRLGPPGEELLFLPQVRVRVALGPLLHGRVELARCELVNPSLSIVKRREGGFNYQRQGGGAPAGGPVPSFGVGSLTVSGGEVAYLDRSTGLRLEFTGVALALKGVRLTDLSQGFLASLTFTGDLSCERVRSRGITLAGAAGPVEASSGLFGLNPLSVRSLALAVGAREMVEFSQLRLFSGDISFGEGGRPILQALSFSGRVECGEAKWRGLAAGKVSGELHFAKAEARLSSLQAQLFGGRVEGEAGLELSRGHPFWRLRLSGSGLDLEALQAAFGGQKAIGGRGEFSCDLTLREGEKAGSLAGLEGTFSLKGRDLVMYHLDLDNVLSSYRTSQQFDLVDLGGYLAAGPLSALALKAYNLGDLYNQTREGQGTITRFASHWKVEGGVAEALDCALSTRRNRIALKGKLDLVGQRFQGVTLALLDGGGCAIASQSVSGPFSSPGIGTVSVIESLAGKFEDLFRKVERFLGVRCEVFYRGEVPPP